MTLLRCGHGEEDNRAYTGRPWVTDGGQHVMCRVCWLHHNHEGRGMVASGPNPPPPPPRPVSGWPRWAKALACRKREGEAGVGDTLERLLRHRGGAAFKWAVKKLTGRDCGCSARQALMNREYPYGRE